MRMKKNQRPRRK